MKEKHAKEIRKKQPIFFIIMLICIGTMIYSGIKIIIWWQENNKNKEILQNVKNEIVIDNQKDIKEEEKYKINFPEIKKINSDVVGWIKVWGTDIEFPVVQSKDNEYYLTHSMDKSNNSAGWIFADSSNKLDGTDRNIVIYGHNRRDDSMFATLKNVIKQEWYNNKNNLIIPFIQENNSSMYEVFSVYKIEAEDYYIKTSFTNTEQFKEFIEKIKNRSINDFGVTVTEKDQILTLSTCDDNNKDRIVLHAKKIQKEESEEKTEREKKDNNKKSEEATIKSLQELNFKNVNDDEKNYTFEYNNTTFKAQYTKDNWKIIDSYKIKNEKDMEIICQALINTHTIHARDGESFRTAQDMVEEWKIHNEAYEILPENSAWKANAKDVDFDPADQGKKLEDFIKDRVKKLTK